MPKSKVRLDFCIDVEHYEKLMALRELYSKQTGIDFNMTQAFIKTLNDYYKLNIPEEVILKEC